MRNVWNPTTESFFVTLEHNKLLIQVWIWTLNRKLKVLNRDRMWHKIPVWQPILPSHLQRGFHGTAYAQVHKWLNDNGITYWAAPSVTDSFNPNVWKMILQVLPSCDCPTLLLMKDSLYETVLCNICFCCCVSLCGSCKVLIFDICMTFILLFFSYQPLFHYPWEISLLWG